MTRALPYTEASITRAIRGVERAGLHVVGVRVSDGTLIVADKPIDPASLVPTDEPASPPVRRFGEKLDGGKSEAERA